MSLEKLRIANLMKTSDVTKCGAWDEVNSTIIDLQFVQNLGSFLDPRKMLDGPLPNIDLKMAQCVLHYAEEDSSLPFKPVRTLQPKQSALGPAIPSRPNVENLNRAPVAKMRVCGWESDIWFRNGQDFIQFWNRLHPASLDCIDLESDEKLVAVLYTSLQGIRSLFNDLVMILDVAQNDSAESRATTFLVYRQAYQSAAKALVFLCGIFKLFCKYLRDSLENAWRIEEVLKTRANTDEFARVLQNAAFHLDAFFESLKMCNVEGDAWLCDIKSSETTRDRSVLHAVTRSLTAMEDLNRSLSISESDPYGFLDIAMKKIQKSFQGMSIYTLLPTEEAIPDTSS